jgi:hypothetical protein
VDRGYQFIRIAGQDSEGSFPLICLRVLPELLHRCHPEGFLSRYGDFVFRLLLSCWHLLPFKDCIAGCNSTSGEERVLPEIRLGNAFGTRIEEKPVGEFEPPAHHLDLTFAGFVNENNGLHGLRTQVVARGEIGVFKTGLHLEDPRDLLFVGLAFEASTRGEPPRARLSP